MASQFRPVAAYRAGTAMAVPHLWGTWTRECAEVGVVVITRQYAVPLPNCLLQSCSWYPGCNLTLKYCTSSSPCWRQISVRQELATKEIDSKLLLYKIFLHKNRCRRWYRSSWIINEQTLYPLYRKLFCSSTMGLLSTGCKSWTLDSGLDHGLDYGLE